MGKASAVVEIQTFSFLRINQIFFLVDTLLFLLYTFPSVGIKELYLLCSFKYLSFAFNM